MQVSQSIAEAPMDDLLLQLVLLIQGAQQADSNAKVAYPPQTSLLI